MDINLEGFSIIFADGVVNINIEFIVICLKRAFWADFGLLRWQNGGIR